jgi:hypothetical protein
MRRLVEMVNPPTGVRSPSEGFDLGLWQLVAGLQVVRGEQEHVLYPGLFAGSDQALGAVLRLAEEPEGVTDPGGPLLGDVRGIRACGNIYARLREPAEVRAARVLQPGQCLSLYNMGNRGLTNNK